MGDIAITEGHGLNCKHVFHGSLLSYNAKENFQVNIYFTKGKVLVERYIVINYTFLD